MKYEVCLSNDSCIFDSEIGFDTIAEAIEWGLGVRPRPQYDMDALHKAYPRAAAYLEAESMANASHYAKAAAGQRALERIINGEDAAAALSDARAEWGAHAAEHMWD